MLVSRFIGLIMEDDNLMVNIRWGGLLNSKGTLELVTQVYQDVPEFFKRRLCRKSIPRHLNEKLKTFLAFQTRECNTYTVLLRNRFCSCKSSLAFA